MGNLTFFIRDVVCRSSAMGKMVWRFNITSFEPEQWPRSMIGACPYRCLKWSSFHIPAGKEIGKFRRQWPKSMVCRFPRVSIEAGINVTYFEFILKYLYKWIKFPKLKGIFPPQPSSNTRTNLKPLKSNFNLLGMRK